MNLVDAKIGGVFDGDVLVESFQTGKTQRGKLYANFTVRDTKGTQLKAVMWDYQESDGTNLQAGKVITLVAARVGEYNGAKQLTVDGYLPSPASPSLFAKESRFDVNDLMTKIARVIDSFEDEKIKQLAEDILSRPIFDAFMKAPAATGVHNNWVGGLVEHVCSMIDIAEPIIKHYQEKYSPYLRRDHLLFGIIFHDIGKIIEYDVNNPAFERTAAGHLVNHIVMGPAWVYQKSKDLGIPHEDVMHLMHLIASHHGCYEWGSPVKPATLEAVLLHHIDNLDSKFMHAWDLVENTAECANGMTKKSWVEGTKYIAQKEAFYAKQASKGNGSQRTSRTIADAGPFTDETASVSSERVSDGRPDTAEAEDPQAVY